MASGRLTLTTQSVDYGGGRGGRTMHNYIDWSTSGTTLTLSNGGRDGVNAWTLYNATGVSDYLVVLKVQVNYGSGWETISEQSAYIGTVAQGGLDIIAKSDEFVNNLGSYSLSGACSLRALYYATYPPAPTYDYPYAFPNESYSESSQTEVHVDVQTAPSGGYISAIVRGTDSFTLTGGVSSMGVGGTQTYTELIVLNAPYTEGGIPQRYEGFNALSATKTISNSSPASAGGITIAPNTTYYLGVYADNGVYDYRFNYGPYTTLPEAPEVIKTGTTPTSLTFDWSTAEDGGRFPKTVEYSIDGGQTWVPITTVSGGEAQSGTFTIDNLSPSTNYTVQTRTTTEAGSSESEPISAKTTSGTLSGNPTTTTIEAVYTHATGPIGQSGEGVFELWNPAGQATAAPYTYVSTDEDFSHLYTGLTPNTAYDITLWDLTLSADRTTVYTLPEAATISNPISGANAITVTWETDADGGALPKTIEYSIDGGQTWETATVVPADGNPHSGTFTVSGLEPETEYTIQTRTTTDAGTTPGNTITASTISPIPTTVDITPAPTADGAVFTGTITPGTGDSGDATITVDGTSYPIEYDPIKENVPQPVSVEVTGLEPNTSYPYTVSTDSGDTTGTFTTFPAPPDYLFIVNTSASGTCYPLGTYNFGDGTGQPLTPRITVIVDGTPVHTQTYPTQNSGTLTDPVVNYDLGDTPIAEFVIDILDQNGNVVGTQTLTYLQNHFVIDVDDIGWHNADLNTHFTITVEGVTLTQSVNTLVYTNETGTQVSREIEHLYPGLSGRGTLYESTQSLDWLRPNTPYIWNKAIYLRVTESVESPIRKGTTFQTLVQPVASVPVTRDPYEMDVITIGKYDLGGQGGGNYTVQYSYKEDGGTYNAPTTIISGTSGVSSPVAISNLDPAKTYIVKLDLLDEDGNIIETVERTLRGEDDPFDPKLYASKDTEGKAVLPSKWYVSVQGKATRLNLAYASKNTSQKAKLVHRY